MSGIIDFKKIQGGIIVSCQAFPDEPLYSSFIMGRMARAVSEGGAIGIRANTAPDILAIQKNTKLPIIGIVKRDYVDSAVYITPTMREINELVKTGIGMIALDATARQRPQGESLHNFVKAIKKKYPHVVLLADIATVCEAMRAEHLGFSAVLTTHVGYTEGTKKLNIADNDFSLLREMIDAVDIPVIVEGKIDTPDKASRALELGAYAVVVGGAITRPKQITERFTARLQT